MGGMGAAAWAWEQQGQAWELGSSLLMGGMEYMPHRLMLLWQGLGLGLGMVISCWDEV